MKEIFEQGIDRENTNSAKWDAREKIFGTSDLITDVGGRHGFCRTTFVERCIDQASGA